MDKKELKRQKEFYMYRDTLEFLYGPIEDTKETKDNYKNLILEDYEAAMELVEKIEQSGHPVMVVGSETIIFKKNTDPIELERPLMLYHTVEPTKLESIYAACSKFVESYKLKRNE